VGRAGGGGRPLGGGAAWLLGWLTYSQGGGRVGFRLLPLCLPMWYTGRLASQHPLTHLLPCHTRTHRVGRVPEPIEGYPKDELTGLITGASRGYWIP
jgi:hypothetical protein